MRVFALMLVVVFSIPAFSSVKITIATDPWCPYVCEGEEAEPSGALIEIAQQAFAESGYLVDFVWLSWARAVKLTQQGKVQGLIGAYQSDAPDLIYGKEHLMLSNMCFFTAPQDPWFYNDEASLRDRHLAVVNGYSYGREIDAYLNNSSRVGNNIYYVYGKDTMAKRLQLLASNKFDTLVEDRFVMQWQNKKVAPQARLKSAGCANFEKVHIGFSPKSAIAPRLSRALDQGIKKLREQGKLAQIIANYQ